MAVKIEFSTREFEFEHGAPPRGRGGWGFYVTWAHVQNAPRSYRASTESVERCIWAVDPARGSMTYGEAKDWMRDVVRALCAAFGHESASVSVEVAP